MDKLNINQDNKVFEKLSKIQEELKVPKSKTAMGGRYVYRNTDDILKSVKPLLKEYKCLLTLSDEIIHFKDEGVIITKSIDNKGEEVATKDSLSRFYVKSVATFYCSETGKKIESVGITREVREKKGMDEAQITGSSSSYARKQALSGLFALDDEKDIDEK